MGQTEAAHVLGIKYRSLMRDIILPQAFRLSLPATIGFLVQLLKGTSLAAVLGFIELTRAGQIVLNQTFKPLIVFGIVGPCISCCAGPCRCGAAGSNGAWPVAAVEQALPAGAIALQHKRDRKTGPPFQGG